MIADLPQDERITRGREKESAIISALKNFGADIVPATSRSEDVHDKIDAWWKSKKSDSVYSVQIKFRESGDDIIFEIIRDIDRNVPGRDMKGDVDLYLVVDRRNILRVFQAKELKRKAADLYRIFQTTKKDHVVGNGWEYRVQYDRRDGNKKLVAYFEPKVFKPVLELDINKHMKENTQMTVEEEFKEYLISEGDKFSKLDDVEYGVPLGRVWSNLMLYLDSLYEEIDYYKPEHFELFSKKSGQKMSKEEIMDVLEEIYKLLQKIQPQIKHITVIEKNL